MANLTLSIDDEVLKRARIKALEKGTSVNALVRQHLESLAGKDQATDSLEAFLTIARRRKGTARGKGRAWTRDEVHER